MLRLLFAACGLVFLLNPDAASAWGFQGHRVVGSIADELLRDSNAASQVKDILNESNPDGKLTLRLVGPWADCVRSVKRKSDDVFAYEINEEHLEYEVPCAPLKAERGRMEDYAKRNWTNCQDPPSGGCHTVYHSMTYRFSAIASSAAHEAREKMTWSPPSARPLPFSVTELRPRRSRSRIRRRR